MSLEVLELKFVMMGVIFLCTTTAGMAPILLKGVCGARVSGWLSATTRGRLMSCASCFSAGVFLFVCFMGLLPAADSKFHVILEQLAKNDSSWEEFAEFPWGFFIVTCGFLFIFSIDKLVHAIEAGRASKNSKDTSNSVSEVTLLSVKGSPSSIATPASYTDSTTFQQSAPTLEEYVANTLKEKVEEQHYDNKSKLKDGRPAELHLQLQHESKQKHCKVLASEACVILEQSTHSHGHGVPSSLIFLFALGIHSLFEGAAIGLQTQRESILEFGVAVLVHELVMALTFGVEVSRSSRLSRVWQVVYVALFTATIPLGIALGAGLLQNTASKNTQIVAAVMEAIATGIFLHVIFVEIIAKEFPEHHGDEHTQRHQHNHQPNYHTVSDTEDNNSAAKTAGSRTLSTDQDGVNQDGGVQDGGVQDGAGQRPSELRLVCEKILSIYAGAILLIVLGVFMHSEH